MQSNISFVLDGKINTIEFGGEVTPTTTVLNYLRKDPCHKGVKEGCAEGDCGACTVVIAELTNDNKMKYKAIDSCLVFLPMLNGKQLITVENIASKKESETILHPVQKALVESNGSQCGFCSPGIIMSMFSLYKNVNNPSKEIVEDALTGNLCRCTGYKSIIEATIKSCVNDGKDQFTNDEKSTRELLLKLKNNEESVEINTDNQQYYQPITLSEALYFKKDNIDSIVINGATDVALRVTKRHEILEQILDLSHIEELKKCAITENEIDFGSGITLEEVKRISEKELPILFETLSVFGSKQIRELASLGGNIGSSSPISDTLPIMLAYEASIKLQNSHSERLVKMNDYILGYRKTARNEDELITNIIIPKPAKHSVIKFYKISKRKDLDISTVSASFSLTLNGNSIEDIKIAYGGMAEVAKRVIKAETFLIGKNWEVKNIEIAMELIGEEFTPISDARSSAEFRSVVAKNLLLKFWTETSNEI